jgi:hypothetical protein
MPPQNPDEYGQPSFRRQYPLRPEDMREMWDEAHRSSRSAAWGAEFDNRLAGFAVPGDLLPVGFWARITSTALGSSQALYSFAEVQDDGTGSGWTEPAQPFTGDFTALEINNNVGIPGDPATGPIVWMSTRALSGIPAYFKFAYAAASDTAFLAITSATPSTVSLQGGGSVTAYPATLLTGGSFAAGSACWYVGPQGELPPLELGLFVRQIGTEASSGKGVYSTQNLTAVVSTTSQTQQTINLVGGGTLTVYPATENVLVAGVWTTVVAGWIYPLSTQQPVAGDKYIGEAIATDGGKIVWAVRVPPANKTVQITGTASGSCSYTWQEVCWDGTAFVPLAGGTTGTATELNCNGKVPVGAIVVLMFIADCSGQTGGGPITIITVFNYCCTTALSSGQGAGGGVAGCLACGNIPMPSTLHVTIPNLGGTCACLAGTYALTYGANVGNAAGASCAAGWIGTFTICSQTVTFFMPCSPTCQGTARLTAYSGTGVVPANQQWSFSPTTYSCGPPFSWSLTATAFTAITFPCAANFGATITP